MKDINDLRKIVRKLNASGPDGFEGLMSVVLSEVTKIGFSLAKSGSQRGRDGETIYEPGSISFEAKRYDDTIPKNEVLSKIAEITANDAGITDLWILGATAPISSQDNETIIKLGHKVGIGTLILDWSDTSLPNLATLLAMAKKQSVTFIAEKTKVPDAEIERGLDAIQAHPQFAACRDKLSNELNQPSIGPAYAREKNSEFLRAAFASHSRARTIFGQALAPGDMTLPGILDRKDLREALARLVFLKPNKKITALLGSDGNGKSWLFGQCWLNQTPIPLTIIIVPNDIKEPFTLTNVEPLLINKLISQTGDADGVVTRTRWQRHFARWRQTKPQTLPHLVVLLDGLNQRETVNWSLVVNAFSQVISDLGAKLVISSRTPFYENHLKDKIVDELDIVMVPEWSSPELEALLMERGSSIAKLNPQVVDFLRNPRIFAVAAELFKAGRIEAFGELSVSRLLFEHIRKGASPAAEPLSVGEFVRGVREHANVIIERLREPDPVDLTIFTRKVGPGKDVLTIEDQLRVISAGRFFEEVPEDPTLYFVKDDGLPLALGLSIYNSVLSSHRNGKLIKEQLAEILDPIAALDKTAEVLLAAVITAVLSDRTPVEVTAALATAFVSLQNLDAGRFLEFRALAKDSPDAFLRALEDATLSEGVTSNLFWLTKALMENRDEPNVWVAITSMTKRWLSMYSRAPERMIHVHPDGSVKWREEYEARLSEIEAKLSKMSDSEKAILGQMVLEERGNYSKLSEIAIVLLAGHSLKVFGEAFRNWCFSASFNGGIGDSNSEFYHLVQLNRVDWVETRDAILTSVNDLRSTGVSETGRWALVYALRATADQAAEKEATQIVEELIKERELWPGWRLIENWCATDPCDPTSERPANITETAELYRQLDVSKLCTTRSRRQEDLFFEDALTGLARFEPDSAVESIRRFADHLAKRKSSDFGLGACLLGSHTAALNDDVAPIFLAKASEIGEEILAGTDLHSELFLASQFAMITALPHLTGDQQLSALVNYAKVDNLLLKTCELLQDANGFIYEEFLDKAYAAGDNVMLFRLMAFAENTHTTMTPRARKIIGDLSTTAVSLVRQCALSVILRLKDLSLVKQVVESGWTVKSLDPITDKFEIWYGSQIMVHAVANGLISVENCIERIAIDAYLEIVRHVGIDAATVVAQRIEIALSVASYYVVKQQALPHIEKQIGCIEKPGNYNVDDRSDTTESHMAALQQMTETSADFYKRHERNRIAVEQFERELTTAGAHLILDTVMPDLLNELYRYVPKSIMKWHTSFQTLDDQQLCGVYNIALPVAQVVASDEPASAVKMFERLMKIKPFIHLTFGNAEISLDSISLWKAGDSEEIRELKFKRLDQAQTDATIAVEVLAAVRAGKIEQLKEYVLNRRSKPEPVYVARALMVAGFSPDESWALETLSAHQEDVGFLSNAYNSAKYAMERHQWSKEWAKLMRNAHTPKDYWRYFLIFNKIMDGRNIRHEIDDGEKYGLLNRYGPTFDYLISKRIKKWKDKRGKTLFGMKFPAVHFLK